MDGAILPVDVDDEPDSVDLEDGFYIEDGDARFEVRGVTVLDDQ